MDCPDTHYQTNDTTQDYCTECFCFGHSTNCVGDNEGYRLTAIESDFRAMCSVGCDCLHLMGWVLQDVNITDFLPW